MSQYPVQNIEDLYSAANYVLSGPGGSGQNLNGFNSFTRVKLRPNGQPPYVVDYTTTLNTDIYVFFAINNIAITASPLNDLLTLTFTTPLSDPPFQFGDIVYLDGVTPVDYDGTYIVFSSTATDVTVKLTTGSTTTLPAYVSGGDVGRNFENFNLLTDASATVTVTGPQDRVIVSAQAEISLSYSDPTVTPYELDIVVQLLRFVEQPPNSPFRYIQSGVVDQRIYHIQDSNLSNTATVEPVFVNVIDGPNLPVNSYFYVMAVSAVNRPDVDKSGYQTAPAELLDDGFTGQGIMDQTVVPGTTFTGIVPTITGTGTSCTVDITLYPDPANPNYNIDTAAAYKNTDVIVTANSGDFSIGDQLTVLGTSLGGATPANDLTMSVSRTQYPGYITMNTCVLGYRSLTAAVIKQ